MRTILVQLADSGWKCRSSITARLWDAAARLRHRDAYQPLYPSGPCWKSPSWLIVQWINGAACSKLSVLLFHTQLSSRQRLRSTSAKRPTVPIFWCAAVDKRTFPVYADNVCNAFYLTSPLHSAPSLTVFRQRPEDSCFVAHIRIYLFATSFTWSYK